MTTKALMPVLSSFFDDFMTKEAPNFPASYTKNWGNIPSVNIKENEKEFTIELAAPGLKKEDFKINLNENILSISSQKEVKSEEVKDSYVRKEFNYTAFSRSFKLPENKIENDNIEAKYTDGILTVVVPKLAQSITKRAKEIAVQ